MSSLSHYLSRLLLFPIMMILLVGCGAVAAGQQASPTAPVSGPLVHLPADQAAHASAHDEWWYVVGHMKSGSRTFGFEVTLFKFLNVRPPGFSSPVSIYRSDVAITDEVAHRFHQRVTYYFPQSATLSNTALNVRLGSASLTGTTLKNMKLAASLPGGHLDLSLVSQRPPMYVGGRGYIPFPGGYTYYYSLTDIAANGRLQVGGRRYQVSGVSWLDHQWGNWSWTSTLGWTWMALQLNNGTQLSIFDVRSKTGRYRVSSVLPQSGVTKTVPGTSVTSLTTWRSPHTRALYPSGWIVRIPALKATLRVIPTLRDQEVVAPQQPQGSYWEGSGRISGTFQGKPVSGLSYTELTGYAGKPAAGTP